MALFFRPYLLPLRAPLLAYLPIYTSRSRYISTKPKPPEEILELERQILHPERAETAQSGTDNKVGDDHFSYDPSTADPEIEFRAFEEDSKMQGAVDPLFISPANRDISRWLNPMAGGAVHNADKLGPSSRGWTRKHREVKIKVEKGEFDPYERLLRGLRRVQKREDVYGAGEPNPRKV